MACRWRASTVASPEGSVTLLGNGGAQDMLGKVTSALDKDGDGNPLNDLGELAKGFFGKK